MYCYRKRNVLRLDLKRGLISFRERKGQSFHVEGPKTENAQEPTVESLVRGIWKLRVSETERGDHGTGRKVEDSQRFHLQTWD